MQLVIAGTVITISDLDPAIDKAFLDLHGAFLSNSPFNLADFEKAAFEFFSRTNSDPSAQDKFFNNFTIIWRSFLSSGRLDQAELIWEIALRPALSWESQYKGSFIHKGTPFYFWGMTAILRSNLDRGYTLIHQALEEDVRTHSRSFPDTPSFAFVTLNYEKVDQAFREWLLYQAKFISDLLVKYCSSYGRQLQLEEFRNRFLLNPPSMDALFLFAYALARLLSLSDVPLYALANAFAGQLEINLLFDITLVIDAAIKAKNINPNQWQFIDHAAFFITAK